MKIKILPALLLFVSAYVSATYKQRLDSIVDRRYTVSTGLWKNSQKNVYTYDGYGYENSWTNFNWDNTTKTWIPDDKFISDQNENGDMLLKTGYYWSAVTAQWLPYTKSEFTYDSSNRLLSEIISDYNKTTGMWVYSSKTENSYSLSGKLTVYQSFSWDMPTSQWKNIDKTENSYDSKDSLIQIIQYNGQINTWVSSQKGTYSYDANGNQISANWYHWDDIENEWDGEQGNEYEFNEAGLLTLQKYNAWDDTGNSWRNNLKWENVYDNAGNSIFNGNSTWDVATGQWIENDRTEYTFDGNNWVAITSAWNQLTSTRQNYYKYEFEEFESYTQLINYSWNNVENSWILTEKIINTLNADLLNDTIYTYNWNTLTTLWDNFSKEINEYDATGNVTLKVYLLWDTISGQWVNDTKNEYSIDVNGNFSLSATYSWDAIAGIWKGYNKFTNSIDDVGTVLSDIVYSWDIALTNWKIISKKEYSTENSYTRPELMVPDKIYMTDNEGFTQEYLYQHHNRISEYNEYSLTSNVLYNKAKLTYYWSPVVYTEVSDIEKSTSISIYPNPASEKIRINGLSSGIKTQVQIHDLSGKLVLNREIDSAEEIEIGELISGVYFVTLKNDTIHSYEKLIVR